jgi:hypothetical protein
LSVTALTVTLSHLSLGHERILVALIPLDAQLVVDVPDPGDAVKNVLCQALRLPALDAPGEGHFAVLDVDVNACGVKHAVIGQVLADVLLDPGIAALIAL